MSLSLRPSDDDPLSTRPSLERPDESSVSPLVLLSIIRRRKYSIVFITLVLGSLSLAGSTLLKPGFVATASVLVQDRKTNIGELVSALGTGATDSVVVGTQAAILRSPDLARAVVRDQHLIDLPEFSPHPGTLAKLLTEAAQFDRSGLIARIWQDPPPPASTMTRAQREELAAQILLGMTQIVNDGRSYVIDIKVKVPAQSTQSGPRAAALSAQLANAIADSYVALTGKMKSDSIRQANGFFDDRINALKDKMQVAERAVEKYRVENGLVEDRPASNDTHSVTLVSAQMAQLNAALVAATADRAKKEASLQQIGSANGGGSRLDSVPEVVASPLIQRLREQQAELGAREAALATTRGTGSPDLIAVRGSERDVERQIAAETSKIAASLRADVDAARARESALRTNLGQLQSEVGAQGQTEVKLHELQNEAEVARGMYATYLKRAEETANQIDMQDPDAAVVSRAGVPLGPAPPSRSQVIAVGLVMSGFLATLQAVVRERLQSGFRSSDQVEAKLVVETLGILPKVRNIQRALRFGDRHSAFAEAIFSIRALLRHSIGRGPQVVMVTSAVPKEGKTILASALARNAAIAGERVLLIDCDLRRPEVARNIPAVDAHALDHVTIRRDNLSSLDTITLTKGLRSPQDLFASAQMRDMMELLRQRYDLILLDSPPVLAVSDARVLSALSDCTILAVCWQKTPQRLVESAVSALRNSGAVIAGVVITQVNLNSLDAADGAQAYLYRSYSKSGSV